MNNIVNLYVLALGARTDIAFAKSIVMPTIDVVLAHVEGRRAGGEPFGNDASRTAAVSDPHCFGRPKAAHVHGFTEIHISVGRKGEHAVKRVGDLRVRRGGKPLC